MNYFYKSNKDSTLEKIDNVIKQYGLSKENKEGYLKLREDYNNLNLFEDKDVMFYTLICYSFNYQFRFNKYHKFNMPFGKNRSSFNNRLRDKLVKFIEKLQTLDLTVFNKSFNGTEVQENDFIYADPPYLISSSCYQESNNLSWDEDKEIVLLNYLDNCNSKHTKFALSNVLEHKGKINNILLDWSKKYNVHILNKSYNNCNYQSSKSTTKEVLITNY